MTSAGLFSEEGRGVSEKNGWNRWGKNANKVKTNINKRALTPELWNIYYRFTKGKGEWRKDTNKQKYSFLGHLQLWKDVNKEVARGDLILCSAKSTSA